MAQDDQGESQMAHRPLPRVEIPLLREERRALRLKQGVGLGLVGTALVLAAAGAWLLPGETPPPEGEASDVDELTTARGAAETASGAQAQEAAPEEAAQEPPAIGRPDSETPTAIGAISRTRSAFGNARSFRDALVSAGLSVEECGEVETALREVMNFRRCRPVDTLVVERDSEGTLVLMEYHGSSPTEYYRAARSTDGTLGGETVAIPIETVRIERAGVVQGSVGDAFAALGLGRALVGAFVEAFEGKINFTTQARRGDTFRIIADEQRIGGKLLKYGTVHAAEYSGQATGTHQAFWFERHAGEGDFYDTSGRAVHGGWLRTPLRYDRISSPFNPRRFHPVLKRVVPHTGTDFAASTGTPVWAAASGTVTFAGYKGANGNLVAIRHEDGFETLYAHLHRIDRSIKRGVTVKQKQNIGTVGSTGRSTGPHLHFSLKRGGRLIDPMPQLNGPGPALPGAAMQRFRRQMKKMQAELAALPLSTATAGGVVLSAAREETAPFD